MSDKAYIIDPNTGERFRQTVPFPDPTPEMLEREDFEAVWRAIKAWDIAVPNAYTGYAGAMGNHVRAIIDALDKLRAYQTYIEITKLNKRKLYRLKTPSIETIMNTIMENNNEETV